MGRTLFSARAALVLATSSWIGLAGCSSVNSMIARAKSPDKSREATASLFGKRTPDGPTRPEPGDYGSVTPAGHKEVALNDETRTNVALAMGEMLEGSGNLPVAAEKYERALKLDPKSLKASLALARVYNRMGRPDAALKVYEAAEKHHKKEPSLYNDKGLLLAEQKDWRGAIAELRQAVKLEPSSSKYHNNLGMVLAASGAYEDAWKEFREAVGPGPAHYNVATMLMQAGRTNEARDHLHRALAIMPHMKEAQAVLAQIDDPTTPPDAALNETELQVVGLLKLPKATIHTIEPAETEDEVLQNSEVVPAHRDPWAKPRVAPKWLR